MNVLMHICTKRLKISISLVATATTSVTKQTTKPRPPTPSTGQCLLCSSIASLNRTSSCSVREDRRPHQDRLPNHRYTAHRQRRCSQRCTRHTANPRQGAFYHQDHLHQGNTDCVDVAVLICWLVFSLQEVIIQNVSLINGARSNIAVISGLSEYDELPMESTDPSNPTLDYDPYLESVIPYTITVVRAIDRTKSVELQLRILGCADPKPLVTKAQIETQTTARVQPQVTTSAPSQGQSTTAQQQPSREWRYICAMVCRGSFLSEKSMTISLTSLGSS